MRKGGLPGEIEEIPDTPLGASALNTPYCPNISEVVASPVNLFEELTAAISNQKPGERLFVDSNFSDGGLIEEASLKVCGCSLKYIQSM